MSDTNRHEIAESLFERNQRRESEINEALKLEAERHAAAVRNRSNSASGLVDTDEQRRQRFEPNCSCSLQVEHKLELG
jgi:hypothetical protein